MENTQWTGRQVIRVIIAVIGVITALVGWLIAFSYIPEVVEKELMWTVTIMTVVLTIGLLPKKES